MERPLMSFVAALKGQNDAMAQRLRHKHYSQECTVLSTNGPCWVLQRYLNLCLDKKNQKKKSFTIAKVYQGTSLCKSTADYMDFEVCAWRRKRAWQGRPTDILARRRLIRTTTEWIIWYPLKSSGLQNRAYQCEFFGDQIVLLKLICQ